MPPPRRTHTPPPSPSTLHPLAVLPCPALQHHLLCALHERRTHPAAAPHFAQFFAQFCSFARRILVTLSCYTTNVMSCANLMISSGTRRSFTQCVLSSIRQSVLPTRVFFIHRTTKQGCARVSRQLRKWRVVRRSWCIRGIRYGAAKLGRSVGQGRKCRNFGAYSDQDRK